MVKQLKIEINELKKVNQYDKFIKSPYDVPFDAERELSQRPSQKQLQMIYNKRLAESKLPENHPSSRISHQHQLKVSHQNLIKAEKPYPAEIIHHQVHQKQSVNKQKWESLQRKITDLRS